MPLFELLTEINRRPEPFEEYTARELWTEPHTSERMLAYHLDETLDMASRKTAFIDRSVDWIVSHFGLAPGGRVADFGCGPGLYAERLARAGLAVTGIDFSDRSLEYARETAAGAGLEIEYVHADYLEFETDRRYDLILLIMCDYCALNPTQRVILLRKFHSLLAAGGSILLDVYSPKMFDSRTETATWARNLMDGFWSPNDYFGFLNTFKYEDPRVLLDKYTIVERERIRHIYNWLQCFTLEEIGRESAACDLEIGGHWGDVAGGAYDPSAAEFAVAMKATGAGAHREPGGGNRGGMS
jgi:SAM-dependent methyltransferase